MSEQKHAHRKKIIKKGVWSYCLGKQQGLRLILSFQYQEKQNPDGKKGTKVTQNQVLDSTSVTFEKKTLEKHVTKQKLELLTLNCAVCQRKC